MALAQAVAGHDGHVRREGRDADGREVVHHEAVVDLVRDDDQVVLPGERDDLQQDLRRVDRAGGVVRVDDEDGLGLLRDLPADVVEVGIPVICFVAAVEHGLCLRDDRDVCPEGVARRRDQDLVAGVEQNGADHAGDLADAVADADVRRLDALEASPLLIGADGLPRLRHSLHVAVRHGAVHAGQQRAPHALRHLKAELAGVAGVQLQHALSCRLHAVGLDEQRPADVGIDQLHAVGDLQIKHSFCLPDTLSANIECTITLSIENCTIFLSSVDEFRKKR